MTDRNEPLPFDQAPDAELGALLRAALDGPAPEAFLARLRESVVADREDSWDVLTRWAPWGVAAAAAAALVMWLLAPPAADPASATLMASAPVQMEAAPHQSESDVLVMSLLEDR
ncbi:MAG TPA: hypothetical protein VF862_02145 [Gemmatimonadales bacterium]